MRETTAKLAYGIDEGCSTLSIGRTAMFDLLRKGEIKSVKIGRRRLIPAASLEAYVGRLVAEQTGSPAA
ncbi:MAG: helix-turn-helix domain-containing protein [Pseudonocardiaceae bacterium]